MDERTTLLKQRAWLLNDVIPGFERSRLPPSWKADSIRRTEVQIADIDWRLETDPPRAVVNADLQKPYAERVEPSPKGKVKRNTDSPWRPGDSATAAPSGPGEEA